MGQRPPGEAKARASYRASPAGVSEEGVRGAVAALGPRRDLDRLRWARGLARHAVDAVRLADGLGLVRPPRAVLVAALVEALVVPAPVAPLLRGIGLPAQVHLLDALREDLVAVVLARLRVLVRLAEEVRVDWLRFVVDFTAHVGYPRGETVGGY